MEWLNWLDKKDRQLSIYGWNEEAIHQNAPKKKVKIDEDIDKKKLQKEIDNEKHEDPMLYDHKTASWESWLDKNNAIETDHKKDKKEEWDGKFDNSTTRDDVKDDEDEKAVSEEESLEELTDGELVEIEKLKSWEVWLDKALTNSDNVLTVAAGTKRKKENMHGLGAGERYQLGEAPVKGHEVGTPEQVTVDGVTTTQPREVRVQSVPPVKAPQKNNKFMGTRATNMMTHDDFNASTERTGYPNPEKKKEPLGAATNKPVKTAEELDKEFNERVQPEPKSKPMSKKQLAARAARKSWESWLEKNSVDGKQSEDGLPKLTPDGKKVLVEGQAVIDRDTRGKKNQFYKSWLEKMQGAGDARFGNQHLTGLDQKPVDDEESEANILPEKDENNEKQEEKEEKEGKDNKPYKALSHE